jgi:GNAT superfamily N-acetyltransferase
MPEDLTLSFEPDPALADERFLRDALGHWNVRVTGLDDYAPAYFLLRDGKGAVRGGVLSYVWGRWLHVDILWVAEELRGRGWGSRLLAAAEAEGRKNGAVAAFLDTFDWQARPFYERFGYEVVFEMEDLPAGHRRYFMRKAPL